MCLSDSHAICRFEFMQGPMAIFKWGGGGGELIQPAVKSPHLLPFFFVVITKLLITVMLTKSCEHCSDVIPLFYFIFIYVWSRSAQYVKPLNR